MRWRHIHKLYVCADVCMCAAVFVASGATAVSYAGFGFADNAVKAALTGAPHNEPLADSSPARAQRNR